MFSQILSTDWQIWKSQLRRKRLHFEPSLCESVTPFFISESDTSWPGMCGWSDADEALSWSPGLFLGTPAGTPCAPSPVPLPACQLSPLFSFPFSYPRPPLSLSLSLFLCLAWEFFSDTSWWRCFICSPRKPFQRHWIQRCPTKLAAKSRLD